MSFEDDLSRLVKAAVKSEVENTMRTRSSEFIGRGGDVTIGGMGNIFLTPGLDKKAFYKGNEIITGAGASGTGITGSGTANYLPRFSSAYVIGNSHLTDDGISISSSIDLELDACALICNSDIKTAELESKKYTYETVDYYGIQMTPYGYHGSNPGNLYIGDYFAAPAGDGIKITDDGIYLYPSGSHDVKINNSIAFQGTEGGYLGRAKIENLAVPPSIGKGGIYYDTDVDKVYVNKGTYASPSWQEIGGSAVWGSITGTLSNQTDLQNALNAKLSLTGGTMAGAIAMGSNKVTGLAAATANGDALRYEHIAADDHTQYYNSTRHTKAVHDALDIDADTLDGYNSSDFVRPSQSYYWTAYQIYSNAHLYIRNAGGTPSAYPSLFMKNSTYGTNEYPAVSVDDSGYVCLGSDGFPNGTKLYYPVSVGNLRPSATTTYTLGASSYYWNYAYLQNIYMNGGVLDFRTDSVHKIYYGGATPNDLVYSTYQKHRFYTTVDTTTDFEIGYDGIRCYDNFYLRQGFANDTCYIKNDASGTMELHVPSGQKVKVVVG